MIKRNPYMPKVGMPIQSVIGFNTMILAGVASVAQWKENHPLTRKQARQLWTYAKWRYPHITR